MFWFDVCFKKRCLSQQRHKIHLERGFQMFMYAFMKYIIIYFRQFLDRIAFVTPVSVSTEMERAKIES